MYYNCALYSSIFIVISLEPLGIDALSMGRDY